MDKVKSEMVFADRVIDKCIKENDKFTKRFEAQYENMKTFINKSGNEGKLYVDPFLLAYALVDYFEDIQRLKALHPIEHINSIKIYAYTSYWLLYRKPIQMVVSEKELVYANERYVFTYIVDFLNVDDIEGMQQDDLSNVYLNNRPGMIAFRETLFYYLKYRVKDAMSLELMLTSFFAGQIYQEKEADLSSILSSKYA